MLFDNWEHDIPSFALVSLALVTRDLWWFCTNSRIVCSISVKNVIGILMEIALNL